MRWDGNLSKICMCRMGKMRGFSFVPARGIDWGGGLVNIERGAWEVEDWLSAIRRDAISCDAREIIDEFTRRATSKDRTMKIAALRGCDEKIFTSMFSIVRRAIQGSIACVARQKELEPAEGRERWLGRYR
jgi:septation ring formation regulator EzrA